MFESKTKLDFYKNCQERLKSIMASQEGQFLEYDEKTKTLTKLDPTGTFLINSVPAEGLIKMCIEKRHMLEIPEPTKHILYNPSVDLVTELSLLTVPIIGSNLKNIVGVFQVINLVNNVERSYEKVNWIDIEVIEFLCNIIELCLKRFEEKFTH